jgi:hypothetical protein
VGVVINGDINGDILLVVAELEMVGVRLVIIYEGYVTYL